ncbi:MAG: hypothetical protein E7079_06630 [Bacteroidales bacterium]|nr:hypothetical protein [Bacteroidales bacterium]
MCESYNLSNLKSIVISLLAIVLINSCADKNIGDNSQHVDSIKSIVKEGDIVFRRGEGVVSRIVLAGDINGKYSHIGMIINENDTLKVAHSVPGEHNNDLDFDRVKIDAIEIFFSQNHASAGAVMRLNLSDEQRKTLSKSAIDKERQNVKFDHNYDLNDTCSLYCTEFILLLYSNIGIDISENRKSTAFIPGLQGDYIMPSDIYNNKKLKLIYNY